MQDTPYFPDPDATDRALLESVASWPAQLTVEELSHPIVQQIALTQGIDYATALLYERLLRREPSRDLLEWLSAEETMPLRHRDLLIGVVPGAFHREYPFTGADGQRVLDAAKAAGVRAERIPLKSFGTPLENATILRDWLAVHRDEEVCLVSLSKGGLDVQVALTEPDADRYFANVTTWINVSGILQGTALADWLLGIWWRTLLVRAYAWWRGYPFGVVREIRRDGNARLGKAFDWPSHLRVFHVVGFPLRRHLVNPWAQRAHRRLEPRGPSDGGGILLADAVRWPGTILPLWGADHYLSDGNHDVAGLVMRLLGSESPGTLLRSVANQSSG